MFPNPLRASAVNPNLWKLRKMRKSFCARLQVVDSDLVMRDHRKANITVEVLAQNQFPLV
jgi:hypothetical protein